MMTAAEAADISKENFLTTKEEVENAINHWAEVGKFKASFIQRSWHDSLTAWLKELGYCVRQRRGSVEVRWGEDAT